MSCLFHYFVLRTGQVNFFVSLASGMFEFPFLTEEQELASSVTELNFPELYL